MRELSDPKLKPPTSTSLGPALREDWIDCAGPVIALSYVSTTGEAGTGLARDPELRWSLLGVAWPGLDYIHCRDEDSGTLGLWHALMSLSGDANHDLHGDGICR